MLVQTLNSCHVTKDLLHTSADYSGGSHAERSACSLICLALGILCHSLGLLRCVSSCVLGLVSCVTGLFRPVRTRKVQKGSLMPEEGQLDVQINGLHAANAGLAVQQELSNINNMHMQHTRSGSEPKR